MQNRGNGNFADGWSLQLPCKVGVNYGSGGASVHQETERTGAIHQSLSNHQIAVAQPKTDYLFCLLSLRSCGSGKSNDKHKNKKSHSDSTSAQDIPSILAITSIG
jgi:hypothetical protein